MWYSCNEPTACCGKLHEGIIKSNSVLKCSKILQYGVLICIRCHNYRRQDLISGAILYALVPCHLLVAYIIELVAAKHAESNVSRQKRGNGRSPPKEKPVHDSTWLNIALAHGLNASLCLLVTSAAVYYHVNHPLIGTICQLHAIIVWLKISSYAFTNRDFRHAFLHPNASLSIPGIYSEFPYPCNITLANLTYFWWAPTLIYQPVYPRSPSIRWVFVVKRLAEVTGLSVFIWLASAQYAAPVLRNSLNKIVSLDITSIVERLMKLSTISLIIWLAGFFAVFQSFLNALAEITRFGDREFFTDWWNSPSVGTYWRTWNKPVYHFMRRHIYSPLLGRGWSPHNASVVVFVFSGFLHELLVGIPTHNILGQSRYGLFGQYLSNYSYRCCILRNGCTDTSDRCVRYNGTFLYLAPSFLSINKLIPRIRTLPLETMQGVNGKVIGNCIFWISFCLVGQPLAALLYFFAWQAKYGSVSRL